MTNAIIKTIPKILTSLFVITLLSGCATTGAEYRADSYSVDAINTKVQAKTIEIIALLPAQVTVSNAKQKNDATKIGALLGGILGAATGNTVRTNRTTSLTNTLAGGAVGAGVGGVSGSLVSEQVQVPGIQITYRQTVIEDIEDVVNGKRVTKTVKHKKTFISAQVGKMCEFKNGVALLVETVKAETRIQPNSACPVAKG